MKLWLLTTEYPPLHGGGISTYCYFTAQMFAEFGHEVTVITQNEQTPNITSHKQSENITIVHFNPNRRSAKNALGHTAMLSYAFAEVVREMVEKSGKPDIIESQDYLGIAYYITQFKHLGYDFLSDIPIVLTLHSPAFIYLDYNRAPLYRFPDFWTCEMEKQAIEAADKLVSPSSFLLEEIQHYIDVSEKHIPVIPNPYAAEPPSEQQSFTPGKIVYYGKLSPQKGSFELLNYLSGMWEKGFAVPLHIIGGTDIVFHPETKTMGQILKDRYAHFIDAGLLVLEGKIHQEDISKKLKGTDIVLFPSLVDNLPYVVMECMSIGKIILASSQGGQREIIQDGINGFLFDHKIPGSFESRLTFILQLNEEQKIKIRQAAELRIRSAYNLHTIYDKKIDLLSQLISSNSRRNNFPFLHQERSKLPVSSPSSKLLSVIIPFYNMCPYIEETINSVLASDYKHIEIIVINDGSTDEFSKQWLKQYKNPAVRIVHQENKGLAETRNTGVRESLGEFIAFLDADDRVHSTYYSKAVRILTEKQNVHFVGCWAQYFGDSSALWPSFTPTPPYILVHNSINSSGLVYKKSSFLHGGLNDKKTDYGLEDYESVVSMMANGLNGVALPEPLFFYRVRKDSMFRKVTRNKLLYSNAYITQKHKRYYSKFAPEIINLLNANGPGYLFDNPTFSVEVKSTVSRDKFVVRKIKYLIKKNKFLKEIALKIIRKKDKN